jgi:hypothetical protein
VGSPVNYVVRLNTTLGGAGANVSLDASAEDLLGCDSGLELVANTSGVAVFTGCVFNSTGIQPVTVTASRDATFFEPATRSANVSVTYRLNITSVTANATTVVTREPVGVEVCLGDERPESANATAFLVPNPRLNATCTPASRGVDVTTRCADFVCTFTAGNRTFSFDVSANSTRQSVLAAAPRVSQSPVGVRACWAGERICAGVCAFCWPCAPCIVSLLLL